MSAKPKKAKAAKAKPAEVKVAKAKTTKAKTKTKTSKSSKVKSKTSKTKAKSSSVLYAKAKKKARKRTQKTRTSAGHDKAQTLAAVRAPEPLAPQDSKVSETAPNERAAAPKPAAASAEPDTNTSPAVDETQDVLGADPRAIVALLVGGIVLLGAAIRHSFEEIEIEEAVMPTGTPTAMWWIEASAAGPDAFLLEFTVGEGDRHVACAGDLELQLCLRSTSEVLAQIQVPVGVENFGQDLYGRPRFRARFPFTPTREASYEWLESDFIFTPHEGAPLVGVVRFMHSSVGKEAPKSVETAEV
jgi:hypothetical protein